jgi:site-specific DNA-cytosine methylase
MTASQLVLSLFPGIGLIDEGFHRAGFCVVRGPDLLRGGDIRTFRPLTGHFDGVIGGPPCQESSPLSNVVRARGYKPRFGNLIAEFERCVAEAAPSWFVMENVRAAPAPRVLGYAVSSFLLNNAALNQAQRRLRRFSFGVRGPVAVSLLRFLELPVFSHPHPVPAVTSGSIHCELPGYAGTSRTAEAVARAVLGWLAASDGLLEAVPCRHRD